MSVEKTTAEEANSSLPVSNRDSSTGQGDSEEARHVVDDLAGCKSQEHDNRSVLGPELEIAELTIPEPGWHEIRTWFQGLGAEERSAVASFADEAFLSAFLEFAVPWSGRAPEQDQQARNGEVDWSTMVSLEEFEARYMAIRTCIDLQATPELANRKPSSGSTESSCAGVGDGVVKKEVRLSSSDGAKKDIGFRIEPCEEAEAAIAGEPPKEQLASCGVDEGSLRFAKRILEHVAIIFPSAVKHLNHSYSMTDRQPFVLVGPIFFATSGYEELFLTLGRFTSSQIFSPDKMNTQPKLNNSLHWLWQLSGERREDRSVPLFVLLLARIGWAIIERFRSRKKQIENGLSNNPKETQLSTEIEGVLTEQSFTQTEFERMLVDIFSQCRALTDLTMAIDVATLSTFVAPLAEACQLEGAHCFGEAGVVEHIIQTPLSWVVSACYRSIDLHVLDSAIEVALQKMADHGNTADLEVAMATSISRKSDFVLRSNKAETGKACTSSHKKKKKKTKKKNKKAAHGECQPIPHKPTTVLVFETDGGQLADGENSKSTADNVNRKNSIVAWENGGRNMSKEELAIQNTLETTYLTAAIEMNVGLFAEAKSTETEKLCRSESAATVASIATSVNSDDTDIDSGVSAFAAGFMNGKIGFASVPKSAQLIAAVSPSSNLKQNAEAASTVEKDAEVAPSVPPGYHEDGDAWETVEIRGRNLRKKSMERSYHHHHHHSHYHRHNFSRMSHHSSASMSHDSQNGNHKKNKNTRAPKSRNKSVSRRIARDILFSIIDSVDDEAQKQRAVAVVATTVTTSSVSKSASTAKKVTNSWTQGPPVAAKQLPASSLPSEKLNFASVVASKPMPKKPSMCDIVAGRTWVHPESSKVQHDKHIACQTEVPNAQVLPLNAPTADASPSKSLPLKRPKKLSGGVADQNTATTYQETLSAVSATSNARVDSLENLLKVMDRKNGGSPADTDEALPNGDRVIATPAGDSSSNPPLPTLLSPERANSSTSSVASSLEAPHAARSHRHSATSLHSNNVGYHLLDVCDKLSHDMSLFMSRRALALSARRRERGAIIAALQDCVSAIWPGRGHVEEYGSCATQLDLPSSDIDVVVRGIDQSHEMVNLSHSNRSVTGSKSPGSSDCLTPAVSFDNSEEAHMLHHQFVHTYGILPTQLNSERVVRLAADIEKQPWAVQVRSIPTASVPVIKILCDPSRLSGGSRSGDWMAKHQHLPAHAAAAAGKNYPPAKMLSHAEQHGTYPQPPLLPWRGSDVMKGLLLLDVTFEGPEHGGIGSTEFSNRAVSEACAETGLSPDATPFVQVLMVLKELLAQRKLNEPYSGGLSSYALLLLVVALMRERAVIKEEIERVERQREAMAAAELDPMKTPSRFHCQYQEQIALKRSTHTSHSTESIKSSPRKQNAGPKQDSSFSKISEIQPQTAKNGKKDHNSANQHMANLHLHGAALNAEQKTQSSSWASIAKKNPAQNATEKAEHTSAESKSYQTAEKAQQQATKPSFAEAVAKSPQRFRTGAVSNNVKDPNSSTSKDFSRPSTKGESAQAPLTADNMFDVKPHLQKSHSETINSKLEPGSSTLHVAPPFYPQGYNDIVEVLCSGETTAGKLLMHFLLYYGQHFDALGTAIDISGKHEREYSSLTSPYSYISPFIQRRTPGSIDPITGMLVVDPIVVYDPLEGSEHKNVARRCFAWNSVRWIFAQSYATLASAVERSATPPATPGGPPISEASCLEGRDRDVVVYEADSMGDLMDPSSPLLRCLLSF